MIGLICRSLESYIVTLRRLQASGMLDPDLRDDYREEIEDANRLLEILKNVQAILEKHSAN